VFDDEIGELAEHKLITSVTEWGRPEQCCIPKMLSLYIPFDFTF
jgi:hypothetical protein